jgi:ADP-ribose pyrophosphatase YjhB (NUDIX family)
MKLFVNNKRVKFIDQNKALSEKNFDTIIDKNIRIDFSKLKKKVLIKNVSHEQIEAYCDLLEHNNSELVTSITFLVPDKKSTESKFKKRYKVIKAAGGVVVKEDKILLIHRLGQWDLPKGKLEKGEATRDGAVREVEEECGIKVFEKDKICATWHTYTNKEKSILKKTTWYLMECSDEKGLKPQTEEGITEIRWMTIKEAQKNLKGSYASIEFVVKKFKKMKVF